MKYLALLMPLLLSGCPDTRIDLTPPSAQPATVAPWAAPLIVYEDTSHPVTWPYPTDYASIEDAYLAAINDERSKHGLPALRVDFLAVEGARAHAFHMNLHGFMSTVNPEGDGPVERYVRMGAYYPKVREDILAMDSVDLSFLGDHLLATDVNYIGIGAWRAPQGGVYLVVIDMVWR